MSSVTTNCLAMLIGSALLLTICGCDNDAKGETASGSKIERHATVSDKPLAPFQIALLDLAFETATAIPTNPHLKDRSKAQEIVVADCLKLDQPQRALCCIEKIDDWRAGSCYADLAFYCAQHGDVEQAQRYLTFADQFAKTAEDWHRDVIRVKIAQTHTVLGQTKQAEQYEKDVVDSEKGKVARVKEMVGSGDSLDEQMKALDGMIGTGNFDLQKNALEVYVQLFNRFYSDANRRSQVEKKIKQSWEKLPVTVRLDLLMEMTLFALDHEDQGKALALVNEAQHFVDDYQWPLEEKLPALARLTELRFRAGDKQNAHAKADATLALYKSHSDEIVNIWRAGALRPLAATFQSMGDAKAALSVYKQAVEEGVENPNSRPRAEDLSATCVSMALSAVEPDAELWKRLHQIREGLGQPW